jgi:hypothetical protein
MGLIQGKALGKCEVIAQLLDLTYDELMEGLKDD